MNPNDLIRQQILQYFYDRNSSATSRRGKKGSAAKISDVKRDLKECYDLSQQQVMSNLTYLIDQGWIKAVDENKTVQTPRGTIASTVIWYEITAPGIDKIEGKSEFQPEARYAGINITALGENVITLGDGNVVNVHHQELHNHLNDFKKAISGSKALPEDQKLNLTADIESIKDQLAKPQPNRTIIQQLWAGIEKVAIASGFVDFIGKIQLLIAAL